jgi:formylglycine-generating enzyme required for sulfatase activity
MKTPLLPGETVVKHGAANMQRGLETAGGWLYLTNKRLIFEAHALNFQSGTTLIRLPDIVGTQPRWTKFLNLIPLFPNSVGVSTNEGKECRFVTFGREAWIEAIEGQRTSPEPDALPAQPGMAARSGAPSSVRTPVAEKGWSVLGIISLVLGILGLPLSVIPCINVVALPFVGIGVVLGGIGILVAKFGQKSGMGMPIAGTAVNFAGLMIVAAWMAVLAFAVKDADTEQKQERRRGPAVAESSPEEDEPAAAEKEYLDNSIGMKLVKIPAGKFMMGAPGAGTGAPAQVPRHEVEITRPFWMGVYEVTQSEYEKVMGTNPSDFSPTGSSKDSVAGLDTSRFPVENASWKDADAFCKKLSEMPAEKAAGRVYRLPTEAEWEYACRGGTTTVFHYGNSLSSTQANFRGSNLSGGAAKGPYLKRPTAVGSYKPNGFGLYDMHGNALEWCSDGIRQYTPKPQKDPKGENDRFLKARRGGGYDDDAEVCASAFRRIGLLNGHSAGFRVVMSIGVNEDSGGDKIDGGEDSARNKAIAWIKANNAFGPTAQIVRDLSGAIDDAEEKRNNFDVTLGSGLTKSGKATSLHLFSGNFFVFELTDAQAKQLGVKEKATIVRTPKRHDRSEDPIAKLDGLKFDSGLTLDVSKKITGQVKVHSLEDTDPEEKFALRLSYQGGAIFYYFPELLPLKSKVQVLKFSFEPIAAAGVQKFSGPMPVFLDLCVVKKNDDGFNEIITLSNSVAAMVDAK